MRQQELIPRDRSRSEKKPAFYFQSSQLDSMNLYEELRAVLLLVWVTQAPDLLAPCLSCLNMGLCQYQYKPSAQGGRAGSSSLGCSPKVARSMYPEDRLSFRSSPTFPELPLEMDWKCSFVKSRHRHAHTAMLVTLTKCLPRVASSSK